MHPKFMATCTASEPKVVHMSQKLLMPNSKEGTGNNTLMVQTSNLFSWVKVRFLITGKEGCVCMITWSIIKLAIQNSQWRQFHGQMGINHTIQVCYWKLLRACLLLYVSHKTYFDSINSRPHCSTFTYYPMIPAKVDASSREWKVMADLVSSTLAPLISLGLLLGKPLDAHPNTIFSTLFQRLNCTFCKPPQSIIHRMMLMFLW